MNSNIGNHPGRLSDLLFYFKKYLATLQFWEKRTIALTLNNWSKNGLGTKP